MIKAQFTNAYNHKDGFSVNFVGANINYTFSWIDIIIFKDDVYPCGPPFDATHTYSMLSQKGSCQPILRQANILGNFQGDVCGYIPVKLLEQKLHPMRLTWIVWIFHKERAENVQEKGSKKKQENENLSDAL